VVLQPVMLSQATQVSAVPSCKNLPAVQAWHCELSAAVQDKAEVQPATGVQAVQVMPSPKVPAGQAPQVKPVPGAATSVQVTPLAQGLPAQPSMSVQAVACASLLAA
jgi:hypothetical protein